MQDRIICEVAENLQRCGYTEPLLQAEYPYQNGGISRIPLVGFASSVRDSRTSCICVLARSDAEGVSGEYISSYRGLGAPVVFVNCGTALQWWAIGTGGAEQKETIQASNLKVFFDRYKDEFAPSRIWRAKNLWRTLLYTPECSVFGVILPRAFLHRKNLAALRSKILSDFETSQICELPENVFTFAGHPSVLLLGRKAVTTRRARLRDNRTLYRRVTTSGLSKVIERYEAREQDVLQGMLSMRPRSDLRLREFDDVWRYCESNLARLGSIADGGQGLISKGEGLPEGAKTFEKERFVGGVKGYALFGDDVKLQELPEEYQRSTIQFADDWVRRHRSPEICRVPREAGEAFEE